MKFNMKTFKKIFIFSIVSFIAVIVPLIAYNKINLTQEVTIGIIQQKVNRLKKEMNLENWQIEVEGKDLSKVSFNSIEGSWTTNSIAQVETIPMYYTAKIYVDINSLTLIDKHVLRHELYHIHFSEIRNYIYNDIGVTKEQSNKLKFYEERFIESITRGVQK